MTGANPQCWLGQDWNLDRDKIRIVTGARLESWQRQYRILDRGRTGIVTYRSNTATQTEARPQLWQGKTLNINKDIKTRILTARSRIGSLTGASLQCWQKQSWPRLSCAEDLKPWQDQPSRVANAWKKEYYATPCSVNIEPSTQTLYRREIWPFPPLPLHSTLKPPPSPYSHDHFKTPYLVWKWMFGWGLPPRKVDEGILCVIFPTARHSNDGTDVMRHRCSRWRNIFMLHLPPSC